jgi:WD40 repeat protein
MLVNNPFLHKKKVNIDEIFDVSSNITDKAFEDKYAHLRKAEKLPLLVFGGGQDSKLVTTTHPKDGGFEVIVYEIISGVRLLSFQSHFGPVNTVGCSNTSSNGGDIRDKVWLASGSEDATVRLYDIVENLKGVDV